MINYKKKKLMPVALFLLMVTGFSLMLYASKTAAADKKSQSSGEIDEQRLAGRWIRTDGGYILELNEIKQNGMLKASYFNPRPINVFKAEWKHKQGIMTVFVELRDFNYPGSKYNLRYDPKTDRLIGTYFQAVYGETYDIEFARDKQ